MTNPRSFTTEPREVRVWIRGIFQLADGRQITRTVRRDFTIQLGDDERAAIVHDALLEELQTAVYDFREGNANSCRSSAARLMWQRHDVEAQATTASHGVR